MDKDTTVITDCRYGADCNPTGSPVGGGNDYRKTILREDPIVRYLVETKEDLVTALKGAKPGDAIFIEGSATIDLTGTPKLTIPAGVTLASNRGADGSEGALIKRDSSTGSAYNILFHANDGARVTGIRLQGPMAGKFNFAIPSAFNMVGIRSYGNLEVDNCEIRGFTYGGILTTGTLWAHHNFVHDNYGIGNGYGIAVSGGNALIEANIFDYNGHSITGAGKVGERYEARYNVILGHDDPSSHHIDVHNNPLALPYSGYSYKIHHNTFLSANGTQDANFDIAIRGTPPEYGIWIYNNVFEWSTDWTPPVKVTQKATLDKAVIKNNLIGIPADRLRVGNLGVVLP